MKRDLYGELLGNALNRGAPPGHFAAYIRPDESNVLRSMGGGVAPDGGQNMYNGMPAYFSGISAVSGNGGGGVSFGYGDGGVSIPSYSVDAPSVNAPSVNFDIQSAVDQGATVAEEFAQAQANAQAQADAQAQAAANIRSGGIAAAAEQARSQGIADILAQNAENETALAGILAGVEESMAGVPVPFGIPASFRGGPTESGFPVGASRVSGLPKGATSTPFGLMYTSPTAEAEAAQKAANDSQEGFRGFLPGELQVVQDPLTGLVTTERSGVVADVVKGGLLSALLGPVGTGIGLGMQAGKAPDVPITFATEAFNDGSSNFQDFSMDDVSVPGTDEIDEMVAALTPTDPTDPTGDPATPAPDPSSQYATVAPDILARILANEQYGRRRVGLT